MRAGIDMDQNIGRKKLNMLSLFSGGGNFDRGLEEGGAVETKWVIEWDIHAIHSYRANLEDPSRIKFYHRLVDNGLAQAIAGKESKHLPMVGDVDMVGGGSPCQGFSLM